MADEVAPTDKTAESDEPAGDVKPADETAAPELADEETQLLPTEGGFLDRKSDGYGGGYDGYDGYGGYGVIAE